MAAKTWGKVQRSYHDVILGHGAPDRFRRYAYKNHWGKRSRWVRRHPKYDSGADWDGQRWYMQQGGSAHHCGICAALHHPFHKRRLEEFSGDSPV